MDEFKRAFQSRLEEAQHAGALDARTNTMARARSLVSSTQGLAKGGASHAELLDMVEVTLSVFR